MVQKLACLCGYYLDEDWELCVNVAHIGWQWLETLQPLNVTLVWNLNVIDQTYAGQELDFGSKWEYLVATLKTSDNFVVHVKDGIDEG